MDFIPPGVNTPPEQGVKSGASAASESSAHPRRRHAHSSVIDLAKAEHARMKELYTEYEATDAGEIKEAKAFALLKLIVQHAGKEEIALYPVIRKKIENGNELIDRSEADHQKVNEDLEHLESISWGKAHVEFNRTVHAVMRDLLAHMTEEEEVIFPALQRACTERELIELGQSFESTIVTTRPHSWAPREGFAAAAAHIAALPLDKAKDALRFGEKTREMAESHEPRISPGPI